MAQAQTQAQYTKAWLTHLQEMHYALSWDLMNKQTAAQSAALEAALDTYREAIQRAAYIIER